MTSPRGRRPGVDGHVWIVLVAVGAVAAACGVVVQRLMRPLVVPLQLSDRYWADGIVTPGQVDGDGAPALLTTVRAEVGRASACRATAQSSPHSSMG